MDLNTSISELKGVGVQTLAKFKKLNIHTINDLLEHYPREHEDRRTITPLASCVMEETSNIVVTVMSKPEVMKKGYKIMVRFRVKDESGSIFIVFYGQPYMKNQFQVGQVYNFYGKITKNYGYLEMHNPEYEKLEGGDARTSSKIIPIYPSTAKLSQKVIRQLIEQVLEEALPEIEEILPQELCETYDLKSKAFAVVNIHFPKNNEAFFEARKRLVFEELFMLQMSLHLIKEDFMQRTEGVVKQIGPSFKTFIEHLPYELTGAQKRVLKEIVADLKSPYAANRLIQGDVGSGKTVIAAASLFVVIENKMQGALMAPTEVLAKQHFEFLEEIYAPFGIRVGLLTGSTTAKQKRELLKGLEEGAIQVVVGTHALIEENVIIPKLGLVITDEQHRFGVRQRLKLSEKGLLPDVLVMTATPIPRTLALILYGDMDISVIDELPPGRQPIKTHAVDSAYHPRIYAFIEKHLKEGRQCYIICPMVEENEKQSDLKNVHDYAEKLQEEFLGFKVGILHGKMKPKEKNQVMEAFSKGDIHVLVSTTVVEVGVNVPNATVIVIENAERFGLAQLHQLRGRVGRGKHQSFCVLVSDSKNKVTKKRLEIMEKSTDGFVIADTDLELRGPGEFFGTKQHGLPEMKIANLYTDASLLKQVQKVIKHILTQDPHLNGAEYRQVKSKMIERVMQEQMHKAL